MLEEKELGTARFVNNNTYRTIVPNNMVHNLDSAQIDRIVAIHMLIYINSASTAAGTFAVYPGVGDSGGAIFIYTDRPTQTIELVAPVERKIIRSGNRCLDIYSGNMYFIEFTENTSTATVSFTPVNKINFDCSIDFLLYT